MSHKKHRKILKVLLHSKDGRPVLAPTHAVHGLWHVLHCKTQTIMENLVQDSRLFIVINNNYGSSRWQLNSCVSGSFNSAIKRKVSTREGELRLNKQTILTWIVRIK